MKLAPALILGALLLTACGQAPLAEPEAAPTVTVTPEPQPTVTVTVAPEASPTYSWDTNDDVGIYTPEPLDDEAYQELFRLAVEATWDDMSAPEQDEMCYAWDVLGPDVALESAEAGWYLGAEIDIPFLRDEAEAFYREKCD